MDINIFSSYSRTTDPDTSFDNILGPDITMAPAAAQYGLSDIMALRYQHSLMWLTRLQSFIQPSVIKGDTGIDQTKEVVGPKIQI